jgi:16S rRNA processing protein RimM
MVVMGRVAGPYGISGWIRVVPYTECVDSLADYPWWWLGRESGSWREVKVNECAIRGSTLIASLEPYTDRNGAGALKGLQVAVPRSQLPVLSQNGNDGYYWSDLIGLEAVNLKGERLGKVVGLLQTGANDVLQVHGEKTKEILIPFISQVIVKVDLEASRIILDWGLDY